MKCFVNFMKTNLEFSLLVWYHNWEEFYVPILVSGDLDEQPICFVKCTGRTISFILQMSGIEYSKDKKFQLAYCKHCSEDEYGTVLKQLWLTLNNNL